MKTNSSLVILLGLLGGTFLSGCGSKQARDQAQSEDSDQKAAQQANQALVDVDHKIATGLYGQKPTLPPTPPPPKPQDSGQPQPTPTTPPQ
jgi:outer membrane murein-binding lipoprotein Lpp